MVLDDAANPPAAFETDGPDLPETAGAPDSPDELALARDLILKAHPETVHELIAGNSLAELLASVPAAEAAYTRIAGAVREPATAVPGGGAVRSTSVNIDGLGPLAKIRAGLSR